MRKIHIRTGKREYMQKDPCELENLAGKPEYRDVLAWFERKLREIVNPEEVSLRAKKDLGLISPEGVDYTKSLTMAEVEAGYEDGTFCFEPEVPKPLA